MDARQDFGIRWVEHRADMLHYGVHDLLTPRLIVIHATAGTDSKAWLTTTSLPPVSAHVLIIRTGTVYRMVPDSRQAWHVGKGILFPGPGGTLINANAVALGVELENLNDGAQAYTAEQYDQVARLVRFWRSQHGYLPVVSHALLDARKTDPAGFNWFRMERLVSWSA
jgi:N-acetyl-anhydromuramyl-L-alanine amidase AmpD